jgi:hypothetical protein
MPKPEHLKLYEQSSSKIDFAKQLSDRQKYEQENSVSKSTGRLFQKFYIETKVFYTSQNISSDCNDITFINQGTTNFTIQDVILLPNQSLRISGNAGEIDTTQYILTFDTLISTGNLCTVIRKLFR